jgi:2-methylisocitrate lyase-like PEP mutase family enzyme
MADSLGQRSDGPRRLRELITAPEPVLAPGAFDALSARIVEQAGFTAVCMTGFGASAALLARPDIGQLTQSAMVENARRIVQAVDMPVIADADTGYGNLLNVLRTVHEYEQVGVAAIHLEDQVTPKKCGHMEHKQVIPTEEMAAKIHAASAARQSSEFVIIARTDARAVEGLEAALDRAERYRDADADMLFVETPESEDQIETIAARLSGMPLLLNWVEGGKTPPLPLERIRALGFRIVIFPVSLLLSATLAMRRAAARLREAGTPLPLLPELPTFQEFTDFIGLPEVRELERRFGVTAH